MYKSLSYQQNFRRILYLSVVKESNVKVGESINSLLNQNHLFESAWASIITAHRLLRLICESSLFYVVLRSICGRFFTLRWSSVTSSSSLFRASRCESQKTFSITIFSRPQRELFLKENAYSLFCAQNDRQLGLVIKYRHLGKKPDFFVKASSSFWNVNKSNERNAFMIWFVCQ